jgi:hypothetical protein
MITARHTYFVAISITLLTVGCGAHHETVQPVSKRIDEALDRGVKFLISRQDADGLWRSDVYGSFKEPSALTPLVASALDAAKTSSGADERAVNFLAGLIRPDGAAANQTSGLGYPLYTAALSIQLLSTPSRQAHEKSRAAWAADLAKRQLDEKLGWQPGDPENPRRDCVYFQERSRTCLRLHSRSKRCVMLRSKMT